MYSKAQTSRTLQAAIAMDIGGIPNKLIGGLEKHAAIAAFGAGALARSYEANSTDPIGQLINHFTNLGTPLTPGAGGYGALGEAILTIQNIPLLTDKLFRSNHLYSLLVKAGIAAYIASEFGVLAPKWKKIGQEIAMGAGAAAIIMPGSEHPSCDAFNQNRPNSPSGGLGPRGY